MFNKKPNKKCFIIIFSLIIISFISINKTTYAATAPYLIDPVSKGVSAGSVKCTWRDVSGETRYYFGLRNDNTNELLINNLPLNANTTSYTISSSLIKPETKYKWGVGAVDSTGEHWSIGYFLCNGSNYMVVNTNLVTQEQSKWCWAAASKSIIDYLGAWSPSPSQSQIVGSLFGNPPPNEPANLSQVHSVLGWYMVSNTSNSNPVSYSTIYNNIHGWYSPMFSCIVWTNGSGGHARVINGIDQRSGGNSIRYMDPWGTGSTPQADYYWEDYDRYLSNSVYKASWMIDYCKRK